MPLSVAPEVIERFHSKIQKLDCGCWAWLGTKSKYGYGVLRYKGKLNMAHRFAYKIFVGHISDNQCVTRKEFCPTLGCCNPDHLMLNDQATAGSIGYKRRINNSQKIPQRKLTDEQVQEIRFALSQKSKVSELAKAYKVCHATIYHIKNNRHYKNID